MSASWTGAAAEQMLLEEPENAFQLLRGYMMLIGQTRVWWRATSYGDHKAWPSAIRSAISEISRTSATEAKTLARLLDENPILTKTRARVLQLANERFKNGLR